MENVKEEMVLNIKSPTCEEKVFTKIQPTARSCFP